MKIIIPEIENSTIQEAIRDFPEVEFLTVEGFRAEEVPRTGDPEMTSRLEAAAKALESGGADSMLSGLDFSSRDVLLTYKKYIPLKSKFFSSSFICKKGGTILALADGGVNKIPDAEQLLTIVEDTARNFEIYTGEQPRIAMLSYSTNGSGGKNPDLFKIHFVISEIRRRHPEWRIDGEMQLDAAIDPEVAAKKFPASEIRGDANVLITPDLNSGNILYKALERFGGFTVAGPMIQGFTMPLADLSRGSTTADVELTLDVLVKLMERSA